MKSILAILLTLITGIGGHFINKRFDRALFFFLAFILCPVFMFMYQFWNISEQINTPVMSGSDFVIILVGIAVIWCTSLFTTAYDALSIKPEKQINWTFTGSVSAFASTLLSSLALVYCAWLGYLDFTGTLSEDIAPVQESSSYNNPHFFEYIYLGRADTNNKFVEPPEGSGYLAGRFMYSGEPAEGVGLKVVLNNTYESKTLITDENGVFSLRVPPGEWHINLIKTQFWKEKPANINNFVVVTGEEPVLSESSRYSSFYPNRAHNGKLIVVTHQLNSDALVMTIREELETLWPQQKDNIVEQTDIKDAVVSWKGMDDATQYLVEVSEVELRENGTTSSPVSSRHVEGKTLLALSAFRTTSSTIEGKIYGITVYAFDENNRFLNQSKRLYRQGLFTLNGGFEIVDDYRNPELFRNYTNEEVEEIARNKKRIKAIDVLLQEDLLDEAEVLIEKVQGKYEEGHLEAVKGYLAAKRGECVEAKELFNIALKEGSQACVPSRYRDSCSGKSKQVNLN